MSYTTRERKREINRAGRSRPKRGEQSRSGYWLTIAKRPSRCEECAGWINKDDDFVYRHEPRSVLHVRCADQRKVRYRPSWRWEKARGRHPRPRAAGKMPAHLSPQELLAWLVVEAGRTDAGGYTRSMTERWGVRWPPPKGWREQLVDLWAHADEPVPRRSPTRPQEGKCVMEESRTAA